MNGDRQADVVGADGAGALAVMLNADTGLMDAQPGAIDFGAHPARAPTVAQTVTFRSTRGMLHITRADVYGPGAYAADGGCVGRTLLLGEACAMTVTYAPQRDAEQTAALLSLDANAAVAIVPLTATVRAPLVDGVAVRPRRVRGGRRLALRYELSEAARVRAELERGLPGRRAGRRCVRVRRANRGRRRCRRWKRVRVTARRAAAGPNRIRLRARTRGRRLPPGVHRFVLSAADRYGNRSEEAVARFRVKAAQRRQRRRRPRVDDSGRNAAEIVHSAEVRQAARRAEK
jgi:hypothetical protein